MILSLFVSFHWVLLVAVNEVTQFGFLTHTLSSADSDDNFIVTLWFNHTIYQNQFNSPSGSNTWFQAYKYQPSPRFTILGSSHCNPESKIMFEQMGGGGDSLKFNTIQFYTESDDFYAIRSDGIKEEFMCIDKVGTSCAPPKQIFYFDISRPNTYIEDAAHIDATLVTPQIETCDPTVSPSNHPTQSPSNEPSVNPSIAPSRITVNPSITPSRVTANPTASPSNHPTQSPSNEPSVNPSRATANPSIAPSGVTANPSITPSLATANPTASPSYHPTKSPSNEPSVSLIRDPFEYEQFTIEIKLNSCTNDGSEPCTFDETEDEINTILIAYLDESVTIVGTDIERDTIKVVLSIGGYEQLDQDRITDGIENELEREYGHDVEVTITKNEDEDDDDESNPFVDFIDSYGMSYIVVVAIVIAICLIISLLLCYYSKRKTVKLRVVHMIARENTVTTNIGSDIVTEHGAPADGNVVGNGVGCKDKGLNRFDSELLYDAVSADVTKGATTSGNVKMAAVEEDETHERGEGSQMDGDESHDSERLYDVGATTSGND